jgi:hypothetical protein
MKHKILLLLAFALVNGRASAASPSSPASKLYVADVEGPSTILREQRFFEPKKSEVFDAQATIIETKPKANLSMVYSNGTGLFVDEDTRLNVRQFNQEPFTPDRTDMSTEPSISRSGVNVDHGLVGICTSQLVAGSVMVYTTPHARVNIRGKKLVIESKQDDSRIYALEGDLTVGVLGSQGGAILHSGQMATLKKGRTTEEDRLVIEQIPDNLLPALQDKVAMACQAKKTVFFDVQTAAGLGTSDGTQTITAVKAVPVALPIEFTVSPATISTPPPRTE